ncbi:Kelch repeat-containing protein [Spirosoma gilvum]
MISLVAHQITKAQTSFRYDQLPNLPDISGRPNPGVAGAFAGISQGALLLAGGANFPDGYPWQNGVKAWQSAIYVLPQPGQSTHWRQAGNLKSPVAYGGSAVWKEKLICLGGNNAEKLYTDVFSLTWDTTSQKIRIDSLPNLPQPLANLSAAVLGDDLYVFGGESSQGVVRSLFVLNLLNPKTGWQSRAELPGPARAFMALVALAQSETPSLFVLGGRQTIANQTTVLGDMYQYFPRQNTWTRLPDLPVAVAAHVVANLGDNRLLLFGGDDGERLRQIEALNNRIRQEPNHPEQATWVAQRNDLQANHPGFRREIWQYRTDTQQWSVVGQMPFSAPVTTTAVRWGASFVLPSGEISPGIRTSAIRTITPVNP